MNCRQAHTDIALWAGGDLDEAGLLSLKRHLEVCLACRCYHEEMRFLMRLVDECPLREQADEASKRAVEDSLWPTLATRLVSLPSPQSDRFNGWVPAVAVAAVCLATVLIASPPQMLAPEEAAVYSSANAEDWSHPQSSAEVVLPRQLPKVPIATQPADTRFRPARVPQHPFEEMLAPGSQDPFPFPLHQFGPRGPIIYMQIK